MVPASLGFSLGTFYSNFSHILGNPPPDWSSTINVVYSASTIVLNVIIIKCQILIS